MGRLEDALEFGFVDERNHRRNAHADRHAGLCQRLERAQPALWRGCARLEDARQRGVERGDRDIHRGQAFLRHRRDQVEVAFDAGRFGDQRKRMGMVAQYLDDRARDAQTPLGGLVGVGGRADVQQKRLIAGLPQGVAQALGSVDLGDDARLEVEPRRHVQVAVRRPRKTVDAAVFAAPVGVDRQVEADVGRIVARQDGLGLLLDNLRCRSQRLLLRGLLQRSPAVVEGLSRIAAEAVFQRPDGASALDGSKHQRGSR